MKAHNPCARQQMKTIPDAEKYLTMILMSAALAKVAFFLDLAEK